MPPGTHIHAIAQFASELRVTLKEVADVSARVQFVTVLAASHARGILLRSRRQPIKTAP